jgi:hypothetical protein
MDLPAWGWLLLAWLFLSFGLAAGMARWFQWLREDDSGRDWHG